MLKSNGDNIAQKNTMSKQGWLTFGAVQLVGCILASYGAMYSESAFVRGFWLCGFLLLLPGNLPAMALDQTLWHIQTGKIFFPVAVGCNALFWIICSAVIWRIVRGEQPTGVFYRYGVALVATGLVFVVANTAHFLRRVACYDCFFPYGVPFTFYQEGGYGGGAGFVLRGLAADTATVVLSAVLLGGLWQWIATKRIEQ